MVGKWGQSFGTLKNVSTLETSKEFIEVEFLQVKDMNANTSHKTFSRAVLCAFIMAILLYSYLKNVLLLETSDSVVTVN